MTIFDSVIRLRRDNEINYNRIKDTFIPGNGEVCLVDTDRYGLRQKTGDGIHTYAQLLWADEDVGSQIILLGYFHDGGFFYTSSTDEPLELSVNKLYLDKATNTFYHYDGQDFVQVAGETPSYASSEIAGILKLYNSTGVNTDGTMTQKAITDAINERVKVQVNA